MSSHHHRPTLKQQNKPFKSRHATKSSLKEKAKGRIPTRTAPQNVSSLNASTAQTKLNRRNQAKQIQLAKRHALVEVARIFNGIDGAPRIVSVVPLTEDVTAKGIVMRFCEALDVDSTECPVLGVWKMKAERFRSNLQFILLPYGDLYAALDAAKASDYAIFGLSMEEEVDDRGDLILRCLQAQGLPQVVAVACTSTPYSTSNAKSTSQILKSLLSFAQYFVPSLARVFDFSPSSPSSEVNNALRALCEGKPADVRWREGRPWVLADEVGFEEGEEEGKGTLTVTGVVRGSPLSADLLVHLTGWGDYRISRILSAPVRPRKHTSDAMDVEIDVLAQRNDKEADDLVSTNEVDDMANEQTWPTEEELDVGATATGGEGLPDAKKGTTPRAVRKVPKGTSAYQAAWLIDEDGARGSEGEWTDTASDDGETPHLSFNFAGSDGTKEEKPAENEVAVPLPADEEEMEDLTEEITSKAARFEDMDLEEESKQLKSWREREKEHASHIQFPDEIDTPMDVNARIRYQRYRGLRSFRTSPWDPNEDLPRDYAKIWRVGKNEWEGLSRRGLEGTDGIVPGTRVTIEVEATPRDVYDAYDTTRPFAVFGLHRHEHKVSVVHFTLQRNTEYHETVRSKDEFIFCVGPRRLNIRPIFSQHVQGGAKSTNDVHKFERYFREAVTSVGTIYGPITFGKLPVTLLKPPSSPGSPPTLVASGTLLPPSTTRIIAKRVILTGHPFKVHKKTATIRYMFFNRDDVAYFKPVQLWTKWGRKGNITESLGTHGYYKAHFDGPVTQMDTVCLSLYKRVYPRWSQVWKEGEASESHAGPKGVADTTMDG